MSGTYTHDGDEVREYLEELLDDTADPSRSDFGEFEGTWYTNLLFPGGHMREQTADRLREDGWIIVTAYKYLNGLIVRFERDAVISTDE